MRASKPSKRDESSVSRSSCGEFLDELLGELAALRGQRDHRVRRRLAIHRVERRGDDVDPAAASRLPPP